MNFKNKRKFLTIKKKINNWFEKNKFISLLTFFIYTLIIKILYLFKIKLNLFASLIFFIFILIYILIKKEKIKIKIINLLNKYEYFRNFLEYFLIFNEKLLIPLFFSFYEFLNSSNKIFIYISILFGVTLIRIFLFIPNLFLITGLFFFIYKNLYKNLIYTSKNELLDTNKIFKILGIKKLPYKNVFYTQVRHLNSWIIQKDIKKFFIKFLFYSLIGSLSWILYILYDLEMSDRQNQQFNQELFKLNEEKNKILDNFSKEIKKYQN